MADGYLECAGWLVSSAEAADYEWDDTDHRDGPFTADARAHAIDACYDALALYEPMDVETYVDALGWERLGHDLWLDRNGHGTGAWDRGTGGPVAEAGRRIADWSRTLGEATSYVTVDGSVDVDA